MTARLPLDSWLLIAVAVGLGLALELFFLWAQRGRRASSEGGDRPEAEYSGERS